MPGESIEEAKDREGSYRGFERIAPPPLSQRAGAFLHGHKGKTPKCSRHLPSVHTPRHKAGTLAAGLSTTIVKQRGDELTIHTKMRLRASSPFPAIWETVFTNYPIVCRRVRRDSLEDWRYYLFCLGDSRWSFAISERHARSMTNDRLNDKTRRQAMKVWRADREAEKRVEREICAQSADSREGYSIARVGGGKV